MNLTIDDMNRLCELARIEISDTEKEELLNELSPIVSYVSEINDVSAEITPSVYAHKNITKEDIVTTKPAEYTERILENAPERNGDYIEVKQVL